MRFFHLVLITCSSLSPLFASEKTAIEPGAAFDASLPHARDVLGFDFGEKIAMHAEIMRYARALADASDRVRLVVRGETWEGREMGLLFISSADNLASLGDFQKRYRALADPRVTDRTAMTELIDGLPVLVWLQESVHGNEISGADSGIELAWQLAAIRSAAIEKILTESIVVIELMQNPDGRDRFIGYSRRHRSPGGDPDPQAAEHREDWPGGRYNHYLFDMNRDWIAISQPETRAKITAILSWYPQVTVDLHEMGGEQTFFAARPSPPANPLLGEALLQAYEDLGKAIGALFDARGIDYFHSETFDSFYPGYGEAWPSLHGAVGVLFEQGSARGLRYGRADGTELTHRMAVRNQTLASFAVVRHAAEHRAAMLRLFYENRLEAIEGEGPKAAVLLADGDPGRLAELGRLLRDQGIEIARLTTPLERVALARRPEGETERETVPEGALLVRFDQPAGKLARTLLFPGLSMGDAFTETQHKRIAELQRAEIYDITAWSLPMLFGIEARFLPELASAETTESLREAAEVVRPDASLGYILPRGFGTGRALATLLREGVHVHVNDEAIVQAGGRFPPGSLIVKRARNPENVLETLTRVGSAEGLDVVGVSSSWFDQGPAFGSSSVGYVKPPRVAMLWHQPTAPMSAGWMRYLVEQRLDYPLTALRADRMGGYDLSPYDVLLMPEGRGWGRRLGEGEIEALRSWVRSGGVLVAVGNATDWLIDERVSLLPVERELAGGTLPGKEGPREPEEALADPFEMVRPLQSGPGRVYGALMRVRFETDHWLGFGMREHQAVLMESNRVLRPLRLDEGENVGRYAEELMPVGFAPPETIEQLPHKPFAMVARMGRGMVIAITEDPNYRAFTRGLEPMMANAIFLAPSRVR